MYSFLTKVNKLIPRLKWHCLEGGSATVESQAAKILNKILVANIKCPKLQKKATFLKKLLIYEFSPAKK